MTQGRAEMESGSCRLALANGSDLPTELQERFKDYSCRKSQAYLSYLFSMPMNLSDEAARLLPGVNRTELAGKSVYEIEVDYGDSQPRWFFYFDPTNDALLACRFFRQGKGGETIVFEGEIEHEGIRLPRTRRWYFSEENNHSYLLHKHIATEEILSFSLPADNR